MTDNNIANIGIAIIGFPFSAQSVYIIYRKLVNIFLGISESVFLISGNIPDNIDWPDNLKIVDIEQRLPDLENDKNLIIGFIFWMIKNLVIQSKLAWEIFKQKDQIEIVVCFLGNQYQIPILVSKILGKKVISAAAGIGGDFAEENFGNIFAYLAILSTKFNFKLADLIIIESMQLENHPLIGQWKNKLRYGALYLEDRDQFCVDIPISKREDILGYLGRFSPEKGILELVKAIPEILRENPNLRIELIGSGVLNEEVLRVVQSYPDSTRIKWHKWVDHSELPKYLNRFKLLCLRGDTE